MDRLVCREPGARHAAGGGQQLVEAFLPRRGSRRRRWIAPEMAQDGGARRDVPPLVIDETWIERVDQALITGSPGTKEPALDEAQV